MYKIKYLSTLKKYFSPNKKMYSHSLCLMNITLGLKIKQQILNQIINLFYYSLSYIFVPLPLPSRYCLEATSKLLNVIDRHVE